MFIHDFVHVDRPADEVKAEVLADGGRWLRPLATVVDDDVHMRVGPAGVPPTHPLLGKQVHVELGVPRAMADALVVPMHWEATGAPELFPALDADLEIGGLGPGRTRIGLTGHYRVPFGVVGRTVDDLVLHGLAEDTVRDFLTRLAHALEARAGSDDGTA